MRMKPLGRTGLEVSEICLGTMTWGEQNTEADAHAQLDMAVDYGVNFIDTAEMYPVPPRKETQGLTETYIGSWLARRGKRDDVLIASKVAGPRPDFTYFRAGPNRHNRDHIEQALNASLKRLRTEYLDVYYIHWPERKTNYFGQLGYSHDPDHDFTPIAETLEVLADQVNAGKLRHIALSNETPWGVHQYLHLADKHGWPRIACIQNPYSLLNRTFEIGLAEMAIREDVPLAAYSPLAFGVLAGKYLGGKRPAGARITLFPYFGRYTSPKADRATEAYVTLARNHGLDPAQMALQYVTTRDFCATNIIGATTLEQLESNLRSVEVKLPETLLVDIEKIHADIANPCP